MQEYDFIVVGGGTAGCVLANRLSANPDTTVLLLEAGSSGRDFWVSMPLGVKFLLGREKFDWCYRSEPEPNLNGRRIDLPRGRMLGGSSSLNGMVYVRGHASDYDRWRDAGNDGWGWQDVLPWFRKSQRYYGGESDYHGAAGEWPVNEANFRWPALDCYIEAAKQAGLPHNPRYNEGENEGVSYFETNIAGGRRASTEAAFLRPVRKRPNLNVVTGALADTLMVAGRRVSGVRFRQGQTSQVATARREIVLAAGSYGSPGLLERSGIGDPSVLARCGIDLVHELPGVGKNLQDHWQIRVQHKLQNTRTLNNLGSTWHGKAGLGLKYLLTRSGPLSAQPTLLTVFARSRREMAAPDMQLHVAAASYDRVRGPLETYAGVTSSAGNLRPTSRGHVHVRSARTEEAPAILNNYLDTEDDRALAVDSIRLVRRIMSQPAMTRFQPEEIAPASRMTSDEDLLGYIRDDLSTVFHPVGTCRMGNDGDAVVDPRLKVRGVSGLRVADASIMPTITSGNTAAPSVMIAERAADMMIRG